MVKKFVVGGGWVVMVFKPIIVIDLIHFEPMYNLSNVFNIA